MYLIILYYLYIYICICIYTYNVILCQFYVSKMPCLSRPLSRGASPVHHADPRVGGARQVGRWPRRAGGTAEVPVVKTR